jgi:hypothetical protein
MDVDGRLRGMDGWMDGAAWMDGRLRGMDGWMDGWSPY